MLQIRQYLGWKGIDEECTFHHCSIHSMISLNDSIHLTQMAPAEPTVQMQLVWCQNLVVAHTVHAYVPPIMVVAQVLESSAIMAETVAAAAAGAVDTVAAADLRWLLLPFLRLLIS